MKIDKTETPNSESVWYAVRLLALPERRIPTIKIIRYHLGLGLREAKEATERLPSLLRIPRDQGIPHSHAKALVADLQEVGAVAKVVEWTLEPWTERGSTL